MRHSLQHSYEAPQETHRPTLSTVAGRGAEKKTLLPLPAYLAAHKASPERYWNLNQYIYRGRDSRIQSGSKASKLTVLFSRPCTVLPCRPCPRVPTRRFSQAPVELKSLSSGGHH
jgi:hypothetical protein